MWNSSLVYFTVLVRHCVYLCVFYIKGIFGMASNNSRSPWWQWDVQYEHKHDVTLRGLGAYIFLDQGICGLRVKAQGVFQGLEIGTLFQEGFLQAVPTRMEILLNGETQGLVTLLESQYYCRLMVRRRKHLTHHIEIQRKRACVCVCLITTALLFQ